MPSAQLQRKLDILSRSSTPKVLIDVIFLVVSELDKREQDQRHTDDSLAELDLATKDPSRDVQRDLQSLKQSVETLRRDAQQLEHTIREAEASFAAQYEVKRAEVNESVRELRSTCERLLRDEVPTSLSAQLQRVSTVSKDITSAALSATAASLRDIKQEVTLEVEEAAKHHCAAALDQLQEECQVAVFASMRRVEVDFEKIRADLETTSTASVKEIHHRTAQCSEFLGEKVAATLHAEPLLDIHRLMTEVQYCNAQLQFFRDTSCSNVEAALIRGKIATLEAVTTALRVEQRGVVGFVSLWDADAEILEEMADMHQQRQTSKTRDDRIAQMKAEYLRRLPALCEFTVSPQLTAAGGKSTAQTPPPPQLANDRSMHHTPVPDPKNDLLAEMSARKIRGPGSAQQHVKLGDVRHVNVSRDSMPPAQHYNRPTRPDATASPLPPPRAAPLHGDSYAEDSHNVSGSVAEVFAALFPSRHSDAAERLHPSAAAPYLRHHRSSEADDGLVVDMDADSPVRARSSPPREPKQLGLVVSDGDPLSGGVVVTRVLPASRMEKHGVTTDDQVLSVNGTMISNRDHMGIVLTSIPLGEPLRIHFFRPSTSKMFVVQTVR
jgi:hypothetical protein